MIKGQERSFRTLILDTHELSDIYEKLLAGGLKVFLLEGMNRLFGYFNRHESSSLRKYGFSYRIRALSSFERRTYYRMLSELAEKQFGIKIEV